MAATGAFVVGVSVERSQDENHTEPGPAVEGEAGEASHSEEAGEAGESPHESGEAAHAEESAGVHADEGSSATFREIDYEAVPSSRSRPRARSPWRSRCG